MNAQWLAILPVAVPLATACLCILVPRRWVQRPASIVGAVALLGAASALLLEVRRNGTLVHNMGAWPAPFGIVFVIDVLSALMVFLAAIIGLATVVYSLADTDPQRERWGHHPLIHILLMGVCGAFLTGDLFNLYVWFEVLLIASFVLLALGGGRMQMEAAIKYVIINLFSSALFVAGVGIIYGVAGTVNMSDLGGKLAGADSALVTTVAVLFMVAFGIKSAVFPLFFWLPSSYHTPPAAISALFAALLTKVGVYALLRTFTLIFTQDVGYTHDILLVVAVLTMVVGALGSVAQQDIRRTLSYQVITAIGFMLLGLALQTPLALAGAVFYLAHDILVKANLFFVSGIVRHVHGSYLMQRLGGIARSAPWLAILFIVPALSLAGIPPLSGFWAKFLIVRAGLEAKAYVAIAAALLAGLVTLLAMIRVWSEVFWKAAPIGMPRLAPTRSAWVGLVAPVAILSLLTLGIGLAPETLFGLAQDAAAQLLDPQPYIQPLEEGP